MPAGDTTDTLVEKLQIRMENPEADKFTDTMCIKALDYAHITSAQLLRPEYLAEFQAIEPDLATASGVVGLSGLTYDVLNYGYGIIMVEDDNSGEYFQRISPARLRRYENSYLASGTTNKLYYVLDGEINVLGYTDVGKITVNYLRAPIEMSTSVDPLLNSFYHNIMLNFAEAQLWTAKI